MVCVHVARDGQDSVYFRGGSNIWVRNTQFDMDTPSCISFLIHLKWNFNFRTLWYSESVVFKNFYNSVKLNWTPVAFWSTLHIVIIWFSITRTASLMDLFSEVRVLLGVTLIPVRTLVALPIKYCLSLFEEWTTSSWFLLILQDSYVKFINYNRLVICQKHCFNHVVWNISKLFWNERRSDSFICGNTRFSPIELLKNQCEIGFQSLFDTK